MAKTGSKKGWKKNRRGKKSVRLIVRSDEAVAEQGHIGPINALIDQGDVQGGVDANDNPDIEMGVHVCSGIFLSRVLIN